MRAATSGELGDYVAVLRRRWVWLVLPLLAIPLLIGVVTATRPDVFVASSSVLLKTTAAQEAVDDTATNTGILDRSLENEISLALSDTARTAVADRLGVGVDDLPQTAVTRDGRADVLTFTVRERTPEAAAAAANIWAETFVELKQVEAEQSITGAVDRLTSRLDEARERRSMTNDESEQAVIDAQISSLTDSIIALELSGELALSGTARVITVANPPQSRSNAPVGRNVALAAVAGALLGVATALAAESLDRTISSEADLERMGVINLGSVPAPRRGDPETPLETMTVDHPDSRFADAYQKIRTAIDFAAVGIDLRSLAITSANRAEGKTTSSVNLAIAMASAGKRVVLADCDLRRPRIDKLFSLSRTPGLADSVLSNVPLVDVAAPIADGPRDLVIIPSGTLPPNPASLISSAPFAKLVAELREEADLAIFDTPPVLPVADALALSPQVDAVVIVVEARRTTRPEIERTVHLLAKAGATVLGAVLVGVKASAGYGYRYDKANDDGGDDPLDSSAPVRPSSGA